MISYNEIRPEPDTLPAVVPEPDAPQEITAVTDITPVDLDKPRGLTLNAAGLLDMIHGILGHWARWPGDGFQQDVTTLWIASTYMRDLDGELAFKAHPRLFPIAPAGSGKTRLMKIVRALAANPTPLVKAPVTAPGLRDALETGHTVFLDEVDRQIGAGRGHLDVQSLISAYEKDTGSLDGRGGYNPRAAFGPMMLGAKPRILTSTGGWVDDLFERAFILTPVKHTDEDDPIPDLDDKFDYVTEPVPSVLELWAQQVVPVQGALWPVHSVPRTLTARMREISQPLLAVADRAVDPAVMEKDGHDLRWARRGRDAVTGMLLKHGDNGSEILADLTSRMREVTGS